MEGVKVDIDNDISLWITGEYIKVEEETGIPAAFEINTIESLLKDLYPLCEYLQGENIINKLSELTLEEYEKNL